MSQHHFVPVAEEQLSFDSQPRKSAAEPTVLAIDTNFLDDGSHLSRICQPEPFADFTIQIAELHPALMRLVRKLDIPRCEDISAATWSIVKNSLLTTFTVRFGRSFSPEAAAKCTVDLEDEQRQLLRKSVGKAVNLGFGDVAMEVAHSQHVSVNEDDEEQVHGFRVDSISLIFGGYTKTTYASDAKSNSVFFFGRIISGNTDFSFLRHFIQPAIPLPVFERMCFFTKYDEDDDDDDDDDDEDDE